MLTGPTQTPSTANLPAAAPVLAGTGTTVAAPVTLPHGPELMPSPVVPRNGPDPAPPTVSCQPIGPGCDNISNFSGGVNAVKGLNAVDSAQLSTNGAGDIEPADQGLCAGNGYVVESNNLGEMLVFNQNLHRESSVIPLDTVMGLTAKGWSSGGDISCVYDPSNGGHWFITEIVSSSPESAGGPFAGCFAAVANSCYEGIAVTQGSNPFGPYNVYYVNANYNPAEPGSPYLLNDFAKIAVTQDAFLLFYDEFPLSGAVPGIGGGFFNGAQEFAFDKNAFEEGIPVTLKHGTPNPQFTVASENMGLLATPNGTCSSDNVTRSPGVTCWYSVIPAQPPDQSQFDNSHGGSGFMLATLDFYGSGDNRLAAFDWTGLSDLNSLNCSACRGIHFGGQLFSGVDTYYDQAFQGAQKIGPIPLGAECGAALLSSDASCPEGGIETNGDNVTQASQAQGQLWASATTEVDQTFRSEPSPEVHAGAAYWVIGTNSFDRYGQFTLTNQGYVTAAHEDIEMPSVAAADTNGAIMDFTLSGNGGPTGADRGGFYPSTAYTSLSSFSNSGPPNSNGPSFPNGPGQSSINIADLGMAPEDGFGEYLGYPGATSPRWGDYSNAVFANGQFYFATNYIQSPNCTGAAFTLTVGTCGGTRDGFANWGTSVNSLGQ